MTIDPIALIALLIGVASIWGAAYLLSLWHEDQRERKLTWRDWPFSRVLAYVAVSTTIASVYLTFVTVARVLDIEVLGLSFEVARHTLTPFTLGSLIVLDVASVVVAVFLRIVRARGR